MRDTQNAPGIRIRGWVALLVVAGFAHASCALAQIYRCTDADGRTAFSDKPCATPPGAQPLVYNDANEPQTVAARCAGMITSCVRSKTPGHSLDECFEKQPVCPAGRLDPALSCCAQACKDTYRRERSKGSDAETATIKVIFGDDAGAPSCVPGMPKRG